jgi:plasmid stabilization system protein ParE
MTIEISPTARRHVAELVAWWDKNRPAARVRVEDALAAALDAIAGHPQLGRTYTQRPSYRVWRLKATPYYVFYRLPDR